MVELEYNDLCDCETKFAVRFAHFGWTALEIDWAVKAVGLDSQFQDESS